MKLDKRIIEGKRPLDCVDVDIAKTYIGQKGYFANCLCAFQDLKSIDYHLIYATLKEVNSQRTMAFADDFNGDEFSYFLPEKWVQEKEPEPVWKPYDLDTWRNDGFMIGSVITFRIKPKNNPDNKKTIVKSLVYLGDEEHSDDLNDIYIYIGTLGYSFKYLFENCEIFDDKYAKPGCPRWRPFGCQE